MSSFLFVIFYFARLLNFAGFCYSPVKTPTKNGNPPIADILNFDEQKVSVQKTSSSPIFHNGGRFAVITPPANTGSSIQNLLNTAQQRSSDYAISSVRPSLSFKRSEVAYRLATFRAVTGYRVVQVRGFTIFASIKVTGREYLLAPPARIPRLEKHVDRFVQILHQDSRLKSLQKTINIQGWLGSSVDEPIIIFNAESTYGFYRNNKNMRNTVKVHLLNYLNENPDLKFSFEFRESDADHIQERNMIEAFGLGKKDTATYLLRPDAHLLKTHPLDLTRPDNLTDIPEWFLHNGTQTINFLEKLWIEGKLTNTVECFDQYRDAINACTRMDIDAFHKTGLSSVDLIHHSSLRAALQGTADAQRLGRLVTSIDPKIINVPKTLDYIKVFAKRSKTTAALLHQGELLAQGNSIAGVSQSFEKETFRNSFKVATRFAADQIPILKSDVEYQADLKDVLDIMEGGGSYVEHLTSDMYTEAIGALKNSKRRFLLLPARAKIQIKELKK